VKPDCSREHFEPRWLGQTRRGARDFEEFNRVWVDDLQTRLARLSTRGVRVIVADSGHDIPSEDPNAIVSAVRNVCTAVNRE
jgi:hypothetical protein